MDYLVKKEIEKLKGEEEVTDDTIAASQYLLEKKLRGDFGKEIKSVLTEPRINVKLSKWQVFKYKLKRLLSSNG
jgi:hypothetical protein